MPRGTARDTLGRARPIVRASVLVGFDVLMMGLMMMRAAITLLVVEVLVRVVSLPRLGSVLGCPVDLTPSNGDRDPFDWSELSRSSRRRLRCAYGVTRWWPFSDGPCLRRSLVGGHLLRRLRPTVRLGLIPSGDEFNAHSWLEIDGRPLEQVAGYLPFERSVRQAS